MKSVATPQSELPHILIYGSVNSGKSTLFNLLVGQEYAVTSPIAGTTTDVLYKRIELPEVGPVVLGDTPGVGDTSPLGAQRMAATRVALRRADIVLVLQDEREESLDPQLEKDYPNAIFLLFKLDFSEEREALRERALELIAKTLKGRKTYQRQETLSGNLAKPGDLVLLLMPQDKAAPKGRLILPQVQMIRELLDKHCMVVAIQPEELGATLSKLRAMPDLVITDSSVFQGVEKQLPREVPLTSFSVLMSAYKGDLHRLVAGAKVLSQLPPNAHILIAEACSHVPTNEDIGRVKLPKLLRKKLGDELVITHVNGDDFPTDLSGYQLVIHCGACMMNRNHLLTRQEEATRQQVPMTNYGIAIAQLLGILDRVVLP